MRRQSRTVEQHLAELAASQHGVVTRTQLLEAGISSAALERRVRKGTLLVAHPGVYRVGHQAPSLEARYLAAVYACGDGAWLSGMAAGYLYSLIKGTPPTPEVTAPTARRVKGVITHRSRRSKRQVEQFRGIPIAPVPAVLVEMAVELDDDALARACHQAGIRYRTSPSHVEAFLARRPNATGAGKLRAIMSGDVKVTQSGLERRGLAIIEDERLPLPDTNRPAGSKRVDFRWPQFKLTVELDGYHFHKSRYAWEQDRKREREAYARGDDFRRYTYGDVFEDSRAMRRELRALLARRPA